MLYHIFFVPLSHKIETIMKDLSVISRLRAMISSKKQPINVDVSTVIKVLQDDVVLTSSILRETQYVGESKEGRVQKRISEQLQKIYGLDNVQIEYNVGGYWGMRSDIDLFDGQIGIELKIAEQLKKATNVERLIGQVVYYTKRKYAFGYLIVLVVGKAKEYDASMKEIEQIINESGGSFIYKAIA